MDPTTVDKFNNPTPTPCCVHLRCKSMYYRGDERPGLLSWSNSMGHWCMKTGDAVGPDRDVALHPTCQPGRSCHEAGPAA